MSRKMVLLTAGVTNPGSAKTAVNLLRYKPQEVVAVLDPANAGKRVQEVFGVGGDIPIIGNLAEAGSANMVTVGIAPSGGKFSPELRAAMLDGIHLGLNVLSGLHQFVSDDPELAAARAKGVSIFDVRKNNERDVAHRKDINERCLRIHTVGHDCNVGKMVVSLELALALNKSGRDSKFVATGQTGIMIEGDGCPVDAVVVDFINGAAEKLVLANQHHSILLIEGQGSIVHPRYPAVTLGLLHGSIPDGLILCYEMGRETVGGMDHVRIPPLKEFILFYETMANMMHPCRVIGVGINGRRYSDTEVARETERIENELNLPACDILRHGPEKLLNAVIRRGKEIGKIV